MPQSCPTCNGPVAPDTGWCEACQRRASRSAVIRIDRRSSSPKPRRWQVRRKHLHLTAAALSALVPGAGQVYKGRVVQGAIWLVVVVAAYLVMGPPAMLVHAMCVVAAGSAPPEVRRPVVTNGLGWDQV